MKEGMVSCKMSTEGYEDKLVNWEQIENNIISLDSPERGISYRNGAFITIWFDQNGTDEEFMQCIPVYPVPENLFKRIFSKSKDIKKEINFYTMEVGTGEKIYKKQVQGKEQVSQILSDYYISHKLPDTSNWIDSGII